MLETPAAARRHGVRVDALRDEPLLAALPATHRFAGADAIPIGAFAAERVLLPREPPGRAFNAWLRAVVRAAGFELERTRETLSAPWDRRMLPVADGEVVSVFVAEWAQESIAGVAAVPFDPPLTFPIDLATAAARRRRGSAARRSALRLRDAEGWLTRRPARTERPAIESQRVWVAAQIGLSLSDASGVASPASIRRRRLVATTRTDGDRIPLLLIHGAWLSARSWERFAEYFDKRGFAVSAPEWPRKHGDVEELREHADELAGLGPRRRSSTTTSGLIGELDEPPVLIGHSFGGLIVELLLDRGLGRAGVALSPAPPKGILVLPFSSLKAASPALAHPSTRHGIVTLTLEEFTYGFVNTFTPEEAAAAYERYAVPETGRIFYEAGFANFSLHPPTEVHFKNERPCAAADRRRGRGPHGAGVGLAGAVQEVRALARADRLPRVRGTAASVHGGRGLRRGRRRDRRLARRRARRGAGAAAQAR